MVSDSELVTRLHEILRETDLDTATAGSVRKQLEEGFGVDLSDRKAFVRDQIDIFLQNLKNDQEQEVEESENEEQIAKLEDDETAAVKEEEENSSLEEEEEESNEEENEEESGANKVGKEVKRRRGGFHMLCSLSPQLQKIVGASALPRTEVVKKIWAYIRGKKLQDPKNRRNIICDESLHAVFRVKTINMFRMNKDLSKHIWPLSSEDDLDNQGGGGGGEEEKEEEEEEEGKEEEEEEVEEDEEKEQEEEGKEEEEEKEEEEDQEEEEEEEEGNPEGSKSEGSSKVGINVKKKGGGFTKLCSLSPQLQTFVGEPELARTEVVKRLWAYIREKNLQDPKNKRKIICDEELQALFRVKSINMFQMNKALSRHIWPLSEQDAPANSGKMKGQTKQARKQSLHEPKQKKRQKTGGSGFLAPLPLSDALVKFFGTGEIALSRGAVVKRMWDYIKQNELQDPSNKRRILCDDKLKELFDVESFDGFSVSKLLAAHFIKT